MYRNRIIPVLTLREEYLVKTTKFKKDKYIGDPINAVRIFNDKEVDELIIIDMDATKNKRINFPLLKKIANESFMPLGYAGGVKTIKDIQELFSIGFEKVGINNNNIESMNLIKEASKKFGSQSIIAIADIKKNIFGKNKIYNYIKKRTTNDQPIEFIKRLEQEGAGEIIIQFVDKDGTMQGYDIENIEEITKQITVPIVVLGGAKTEQDIDKAIQAGASAAAAGSMFVFYGPHKAVLINYIGGKN